MNLKSRNLWVAIAHWAARALVLGVLALWGMFFVAHTREWFVAPFPQVPPLKVCVFQALHLLLLLGLLASLRWARVGLVWVTTAACAFFLPVAGLNALGFVALTILPVLLVTLTDRLRRADQPPIQFAS